MLELVFVCTGNTCRSPMAEYIFRKLLAEEGLRDWQVSSAGLMALPGQSISEMARKVMEKDGTKVDGHLSRLLSREILERADVVLTMTDHHRKMILDSYPEFSNKVFTIRGFLGQEANVDISDPYGQSEERYRKTRDEIKEISKMLLGKLNYFSLKEEGNLRNLENNKHRGDKVNIAIGSDHAGYEFKQEIIKYLEDEGYQYKDMGTDSTESIDYPDYGYKVASAVAEGEYDKGILICGTGIGMSITANKVKGIRAALCHDVFSARATRNHNNSNVLAMGARVIGIGLALEIVKTWLGEDFDGGRHQRRVDKMHSIERGEYKGDE